jgi:hypothetical protein
MFGMDVGSGMTTRANIGLEPDHSESAGFR